MAFFIGYIIYEHGTLVPQSIETHLGQKIGIYNGGLNNYGYFWSFNGNSSFEKVTTPAEYWNDTSSKLWTGGDKIGMLIDFENQTVKYYKNDKFIYEAPHSRLNFPTSEKEVVYVASSCCYDGDSLTLLPYRCIPQYAKQ